MLRDGGKIEDVSFQIYLKWFETFVDDCPVHQIVYVNTDPSTCYERIAKRSRAGESGIPLDYLQKCHRYHSDMLDRESINCPCSNQLVLNGNVDIYQDEENLKHMLSQVLKYIGIDTEYSC